MKYRLSFLGAIVLAQLGLALMAYRLMQDLPQFQLCGLMATFKAHQACYVRFEAPAPGILAAIEFAFRADEPGPERPPSHPGTGL